MMLTIEDIAEQAARELKDSNKRRFSKEEIAKSFQKGFEQAILKKYSEMIENGTMAKPQWIGWTPSLSGPELAKQLIPIQPLPPGALPIYSKDDLRCVCGDCTDSVTCVGRIGTVHYADTDDYGILPTACERGVVSLPQDIRWSSDKSKVTCSGCRLVLDMQEMEDKMCIEALDKAKEHITITGVDYAVINTKGITKMEIVTKHNGMSCKKCNTFNEYVSEGNQLDGSYVCYSCRSEF